jgi:carbon-monoxide dehydrogenase large subunit
VLTIARTVELGGGFGAKSGATPEYLLAGHFAVQLGRPVKWVATRSEDVQVTTQRRDMSMYVELAARLDGTLLGLTVHNMHCQSRWISAFGVGDTTDIHPDQREDPSDRDLRSVLGTGSPNGALDSCPTTQHA